jgi:hypothetical protein
MKFILLTILAVILFSVAFSQDASNKIFDANVAMQAYARTLLDQGQRVGVELRIVNDIMHREAFRVVHEDGLTKIEASTPAGWIYGVQTVLHGEAQIGRLEQPCFDIRGTMLWIEGAVSDNRIVPYSSEFNAAKFPWFFDRVFMTRYLDAISNARYNTIFVWASHPFPNILELPGYPNATNLTHEQLMQNQEQFRWFTSQCQRRNIRVLLHFYNIHLPNGLRDEFNANPSWGASAVTKPTPEIASYYRYILKRYFEEFSNVGLYICPGETLGSSYQLDWFRDVLFASARNSCKNPLLVIRDWTMNMDLRSQIRALYENSYSELKHNDESFTSPIPDRRHEQWRGVLQGHIINLHGPPMDLQPMRWASPVLIRETVSEWLNLGFVKGAEIYALSCFDWPNTQDKLEPGQFGYREQIQGRTLLSLDRDLIYFDVFGRYLWNVNRKQKDERKFWEGYLIEKFGSRQAGKALYQWYVLSGPISPGMQNLTAVKFGNFWATMMLQNQGVDDILKARTRIDDIPITLASETGRTRQIYYSQPVDSYFFDRYKEKYRLPGLTQRISMPVAQYAAELSSGREVINAMTPDKVCDMLCILAAEALKKALVAQDAISDPADREELNRFVSDSRMYVLATEALRHKVQAAIIKARILYTGQTDMAELFIDHLEKAVAVYEDLAALTDQTYRNANDLMGRHWKREGLAEFRKDLSDQQVWIKALTE